MILRLYGQTIQSNMVTNAEFRGRRKELHEQTLGQSVRMVSGLELPGYCHRTIAT